MTAFDVLERATVAVEPDATARRIRQFARRHPGVVRDDRYRRPAHDGTVYGACYALNEAYFHAAGGRDADLGIYCLSWGDVYPDGDGTHWYLRAEPDGRWIDLSLERAREGATVPFERGRKRAWMTGYEPSNRTERVLAALNLEVSDA